MKVLDIISEGIGSYFAKKAVVEQIAKGWVKEIRLYKQEFGSIPKLDELIDFAPAEKLTKEKAIARDPDVQSKAYKEAVAKFKAEERSNLWKLGKEGLAVAAKKLGNGGSWVAWIVKWGSTVFPVVGAVEPWNAYNDKVEYALEMLAKGPENGGWTPEQFKTYHDRIQLVFFAEAGVSIATAIGSVGLASWIGKIPLDGAVRFLGSITSTLGTVGMNALQNKIQSPEGGRMMAYYLTAQGMKADGIEKPPSDFGKGLEQFLTLYAAEDKFKQWALEAAEKGKQGDKIPPKLRPKDSDKPAATSASSAPTAPGDHEEEPPVSGGAPNRPSQGAQPAGTSSEWK
jgi:hypothetical protein